VIEKKKEFPGGRVYATGRGGISFIGGGFEGRSLQKNNGGSWRLVENV